MEGFFHLGVLRIFSRLGIIRIISIYHIALLAVSKLAAHGGVVLLLGLVVLDRAFMDIVIVTVFRRFHL